MASAGRTKMTELVEYVENNIERLEKDFLKAEKERFDNFCIAEWSEDGAFDCGLVKAIMDIPDEDTPFAIIPIGYKKLPRRKCVYCGETKAKNFPGFHKFNIKMPQLK